MKRSIEVTFPDLDRIREYSKNKNFLSPQEMIRKAVTQYMNQYKDDKETRDSEIEALKERIAMLEYKLNK